jgi:2-amino-4-hydroxy-6-hydroxymethyldihydropteridine diphosphokinase
LKGNGRNPDVAFLSLGSNLGDRREYLRRAEKGIMRHPAMVLLASSSVRETLPLGFTGQPQFLNQVLKVETRIPPRELLAELLALEGSLGRRRGLRWGPRTIDIDLLLYGSEVMNTPALTIPHPELRNRAFLIYLLVELDEGLRDPLTGKKLVDFMREWGDEELLISGTPYESASC